MIKVSISSLICCIQVFVSEEGECSGGELELGAWRHLVVAAPTQYFHSAATIGQASNFLTL